jgi:GNAT superfamily N-acetyltransferase
MDMYAYFLQTTEVLKGKLEAVAASCASRYGVRLRQADMRRFDRELGIFMEIYNKAWGQNWGFVPMTQEEIAWTARELRSIVLPEFAYIAEVGSKPVGFAIGIPDINQVQKRLNGRLFPLGWLYLVLAKRRIRYLRIFALGVLPEYQHMGIGSILYLEFIKEGIRRGYKGAELSWVLETNQRMNKPLLSMGAKPYKVYRIYQKALP